MKKLTILLISALVIAAGFAKISKPGTKRTEATEPAALSPSFPTSSTGPVEAGNKALPSAAPTAVAEAAVQPTPPPQAGVVEKALSEIPSREEFERTYSSYKPSELRRDLQRSEAFVAQQRLVERANAQQLQGAELRRLATEVRRQSVIRCYLLSRQVARLKEKYK